MIKIIASQNIVKIILSDDIFATPEALQIMSDHYKNYDSKWAVGGFCEMTNDGTKFFKTVTAVSVSAQPAANIKLGHLATTVKAAIFGGSVRIKGVMIVNSATAGTIDFVEGSTTGTTVMQLRTIGDDETSRDVTIPEQGVVCRDGAFISYTSATFAFMTVFFA